MIVVQRIVTRWSKASRGAPGAAQRNAVPEALVLPEELLAWSGDVALHHQVDHVEREGFAPRTRAGADTAVAPVPPWAGKPSSVQLSRAGDALAVAFRPDTDCGIGSRRPPRGPLPRDAADLRLLAPGAAALTRVSEARAGAARASAS